jgi:hypothetical protein
MFIVYSCVVLLFSFCDVNCYIFLDLQGKLNLSLGILIFWLGYCTWNFVFFLLFFVFIFGFWVLWGERKIKVFFKAYSAFCYYFSFHLGLLLPSWFSKSSYSILKVSFTWLFFHIASKVALKTWWILFDYLPKILNKILNTYL